MTSDTDAPNSHPEVVTAQPEPIAEPEPVQPPDHGDKNSVHEKPAESLTRTQVNETMQRSLGRIGADCGSRRDDDEPKKVTVRLKVTPSGDVAWAEQHGEEHPSAYTRCVLDVVENLSFPKAKKPLTINFPLIYGR